MMGNRDNQQAVFGNDPDPILGPRAMSQNPKMQPT